jgi:hypothetical protein
LISALDGSELSASFPGRFTAGEKALGTHLTECCVGPRARLDAVTYRKISFACRESNLGRPTHKPSLYRLSYTGLLKYQRVIENKKTKVSLKSLLQGCILITCGLLIDAFNSSETSNDKMINKQHNSKNIYKKS